MTQFKVGDEFYNISMLKETIDLYAKSNNIQLYIANSRLIKSAKAVSRFIEPELQYYELEYYCIHGGPRAFKTHSSGERKSK